MERASSRTLTCMPSTGRGCTAFAAPPDALEPIFNGDNEKTHKLLKKAAKERKKASAKKKEQIFHS